MIAPNQPSKNLAVKKDPTEIIDDLMARNVQKGVKSCSGDMLHLSERDSKVVVNFYNQQIATAKRREIKLLKEMRMVFLVTFLRRSVITKRP